MSTEITITKVKLLSGNKVEIDFSEKTEKQKKPAECGKKYQEPPHQDFINALSGLDVHSALIGEFVSVVNIPDIFQPDKAIIDKFHVSGITILKPGQDDEGLIMTAGKTLSTGKYMNFNTPLVRFNDISEGKYPYLNEIQEAVGTVLKEAELYLGGKFAPEIKQGELRLDNNNDGTGTDDGENKE